MSINTQLPAIFSSLALGAPNPVRTYSSPLEGKATKGKISVITLYDSPIKIQIEFEQKQKTGFPFDDAKRVLTIDLKTGKGTLTRKPYTSKGGELIPEATAEFRSDAEYNADDRKPPRGLRGDVLGQDNRVHTAQQNYYDIADLPIIKAYSQGDRRQVEIEIDKLIKKK